MPRRLFTLASALSLLLCTGAILVWGCSFFAFAPIGQYWTTSWDGNGSGWAGHGWIAVNGTLHLLRDDRTVTPAPISAAVQHSRAGIIDPAPAIQPRQTRWGFAYVNKVWVWRERGSARVWSMTNQQLSTPAWLPALLFSILPALWLNGFIRRRRFRARGLCPTCGYDLRATPDRCPECGHTPKGPTA